MDDIDNDDEQHFQRTESTRSKRSSVHLTPNKDLKRAGSVLNMTSRSPIKQALDQVAASIEQEQPKNRVQKSLYC